MCEAPLNRIFTVEFLGIVLTSDLTWNGHISHIVNKATHSLGMLKVLVEASTKTKLMAYTTSCMQPQFMGSTPEYP